MERVLNTETANYCIDRSVGDCFSGASLSGQMVAVAIRMFFDLSC